MACRAIRDGKDIGYTYICEQQAGDIPASARKFPTRLPGSTRRNPSRCTETPRLRSSPATIFSSACGSTTIDQGVRADKTRGPVRVDSEAWLLTTLERNHEEWSREIVVKDDTMKKPIFNEELGDSNRRLKEVLAPVASDAPIGPRRVEAKEDYKLEVEDVKSGAALPTLSRPLPPFYTPQAISQLLPWLLPLHEPRGYMFATYVGDAREVMHRYVDVQPKQAVNILGKTQFAIPVDDRIGLDGSVTTYYFSPQGKFLGSENKDSNIWIVPTDADTLQGIWSNRAQSPTRPVRCRITTPRRMRSNTPSPGSRPNDQDPMANKFPNPKAQGSRSFLVIGYLGFCWPLGLGHFPPGVLFLSPPQMCR